MITFMTTYKKTRKVQVAHPFTQEKLYKTTLGSRNNQGRLQMVLFKRISCTKAKEEWQRYWEIPQEWSLDEVQ